MKLHLFILPQAPFVMDLLKNQFGEGETNRAVNKGHHSGNATFVKTLDFFPRADCECKSKEDHQLWKDDVLPADESDVLSNFGQVTEPGDVEY